MIAKGSVLSIQQNDKTCLIRLRTVRGSIIKCFCNEKITERILSQNPKYVRFVADEIKNGILQVLFFDICKVEPKLQTTDGYEVL